MKSWRKGTSPVINLVIKVSLPADSSDPVGAGTPRFQGPLRPASKDSELATTQSTTLFLVLDLSAQLSNHNGSQTTQDVFLRDTGTIEKAIRWVVRRR
jgi:hypothetical protein